MDILFRFAIVIGGIIIPYIIGNYLINKYGDEDLNLDSHTLLKLLKIILSWLIGMLIICFILAFVIIMYNLANWIITGNWIWI